MLRVIDGDRPGQTTDDALSLTLDVIDPLVVDYLQSFDQLERHKKALEALKVGVIALRSVTPALDTGIVEQKFQQLERSLQDYADGFVRGLEDRMEHYFRAETGAVSRQLESFMGNDGSLPKTLEQYFNSEHGRLIDIVRGQIGPESDFGKAVDPDNSRGLLQRIENVVAAKLDAASSHVLEQFSLDEADSAVSRLQSLIAAQIVEVKNDNARFFAELKEHFGVERGREEEALKGTRKGRDFESAIYERLARICQDVGDLSENLTSSPGDIPRCKTGDYVTTLGADSGASGERIVIEAKNRAGYTLRSALDELKTAKENRAACAAIMVFESECCPIEIGSFRIIHNDIILRAGEEGSSDTDFYLESAYRIARALVVANKQRHFNEELDVSRIADAICRIERACERFSEIHKKAASIRQNAAGIEELTEALRPEVQQALHEIESVVRADVNQLVDARSPCSHG